MNKYETVKFNNDSVEIDVTVSPLEDTVWLSQEQMALLFNVNVPAVNKHIKNIISENELDEGSTVSKMEIVRYEGNRRVKRNINIYNLDMIISVGYRVNSVEGIKFRRWANKVLKEYLIQGYSINQKRIEVLNKTISIQNKMLASTLNIDEKELVNVIDEYTKALDLLDDYDHQRITKPKGRETISRLTYIECRDIIDSMKFSNTSNVFGVEKQKGKLEDILAQVYQNVFSCEVYPSLEEKAAHLLYF